MVSPKKAEFTIAHPLFIIPYPTHFKYSHRPKLTIIITIVYYYGMIYEIRV